jgi:hypothetical protein
MLFTIKALTPVVREIFLLDIQVRRGQQYIMIVSVYATKTNTTHPSPGNGSN